MSNLGKPLSSPSAAPAGEPDNLLNPAPLNELKEAIRAAKAGDAVPRTPEPMTAEQFEMSEEWADMCKAGHPTDWHSFAEAYAEAVTAQLRAELTELQATFDLRWQADMRAIKQWQAAHPGKENIWPDHADLVLWLEKTLAERDQEIATLRAQNTSLKRHISRSLRHNLRKAGYVEFWRDPISGDLRNLEATENVFKSRERGLYES